MMYVRGENKIINMFVVRLLVQCQKRLITKFYEHCRLEWTWRQVSQQMLYKAATINESCLCGNLLEFPIYLNKFLNGCFCALCGWLSGKWQKPSVLILPVSPRQQAFKAKIRLDRYKTVPGKWRHCVLPQKNLFCFT